MKKIAVMLMVCLISVFSLVGCFSQEVEYEATSSNSMFVKVENASDWWVVYHKETKVMYVVSKSRYNYGNFTLMVDENGKPLLWQGK